MQIPWVKNAQKYTSNSATAIHLPHTPKLKATVHYKTHYVVC